MTGHGTYRTAGGDVYEGGFKRGEREGRGVYKSANGDKYDGIWRRDKYEGRGTFRTALSGDVYTGEFLSGKKDGCPHSPPHFHRASSSPPCLCLCVVTRSRGASAGANRFSSALILSFGCEALAVCCSSSE